MNIRKVRTVLPYVLLLIVAIGYVTKFSIGTPSAVGWSDIALMCPLGALGTMLAEKLLIPRALVSLVIVIVLILLFGRAFCSWLCPVPTISKLRGIFQGKTSDEIEREAEVSNRESMQVGQSEGESCGNCSSCKSANQPLKSRYVILAAALVSTLVFGFPVFCLVCPVGLSFATILLVIRLFSVGDVTWTLVFVPVLLLIEVVFFRKWCHTFCPLGAFMSLVSKGNRTFRPTIDDSMCIETTTGEHCQRCAHVCPEGVNPRVIANGAALSECTKCHRCVEVCPKSALTMPVIAHAATKQASSDDTVESSDD